MRASEAAKHLPFNERQVIAFYGDRDFDMVEVTAMRNRWMLDTLELRDRFYRHKQTDQKIIDEIAEEL